MAVDLTALQRRVAVLSARSALVVDTGIAVMCYLAMVATVPTTPGIAGSSVFVLAAVASLPLVWRRQRPVTVTTLVGAGTIGLCAVGAQGHILLPYGQLVATYTIASLASPLWRLVVMLGTGIGVLIAVLLLLRMGPATLTTAGLAFMVAYALGTGSRARRDRIAMLEERTVRLAQQREAAAVRERERIARELHDIVAHSVTVMVIQAESGAVLAADTDKATAAFESISAAGREAIIQLDRALGVLRGDGAALNPAPALADLPTLVRCANQSGLDATLTIHGTPRPHSADLAAAVYRLVQEALTNTVRHAFASRAAVRLDWLDDRLRVEVADDGRGLEPGAADLRHGRGLIGMHERVRTFGGVLDVGSGDGGIGLRLIASLPFAAPEGTHGC
jgi:signal transduction histidine kinase